MGVLEAGKGQAEVIKSAVEKLAGNGDAEIGHLGEVRESHPARWMLLAKDDLPIRTVHRPPSPNAALEGSPRSVAQVWMPTAIVHDARNIQHGRAQRRRFRRVVG